MKKLVLLPLAVLFVIAGCQDIQKERLRAESQMTAPSFSIEGGDLPAAPRSTVCVAYDNELVRLQDQLADEPDNADLQMSLASVESVLANSCE